MGQLLSINQNLPPANALESELAVLGNSLVSQEVFDKACVELRVEHFYSDAHKAVWACMLEARREGAPLHPVDLKARLERTGRLDAIGGSPFLGELLCVPPEDDVSTHVRLIREAWTKRRIGELGSRIAVESKNGVRDVESWAGEQLQALARLIEPTRPRVDPWGQRLDVHALFVEELPPVRWAMPGLELGPGRPCGVWGKPGSGKTLFVQEIALAVATGGTAFGRWECPKGRVLHLSYDFGAQAVKIRYRQLANGLGLGVEDLGDRLEVRVFPAVYLNDPHAEQLFRDLCTGFDLVILDCLRDALPGADENDSLNAVHLKMLARVSEALNSTFIYLHHLKKGDEDITIDSGRGSGSIGAASGTVWGLDGQGDEPRTAKHIRQHDVSAGPQKPFIFEKHGSVTPGSFVTPYPAIRLLARSAEEQVVEVAMARVEQNMAVERSNTELLVRILLSTPNLMKRELRARAKGTPLCGDHWRALDGAIESALEDGLVEIKEVSGRGGKRQIYNATRRGATSLTKNWDPSNDL